MILQVTCYGMGTTQSTTYASNSYSLYWSCDVEVPKNGKSIAHWWCYGIGIRCLGLYLVVIEGF
jgi:hypothetical protein